MIWELQDFIDNIPNNYKFVRIGDGIDHVMDGKNLREHDSFPNMVTDLEKVLENKDLMFGLQNSSADKFPKDREWQNADVFHYASRDGKLKPFIDALNKYNVAFISPPFHIKLGLFDNFIGIPSRNCYLEKENIKRAIKKIDADIYCWILTKPCLI